LNDVAILQNISTFGGGIYVSNAPVTMNRTIISGNSATFGGGFYASASGGSPPLSAIFSLDLTDTMIAKNVATSSCADTQLVGFHGFDLDLIMSATIHRSTASSCGFADEPDRKTERGRDHKATSHSIARRLVIGSSRTRAPTRRNSLPPFRADRPAQ
jgi:hypothetical protein